MLMIYTYINEYNIILRKKNTSVLIIYIYIYINKYDRLILVVKI